MIEAHVGRTEHMKTHDMAAVLAPAIFTTYFHALDLALAPTEGQPLHGVFETAIGYESAVEHVRTPPGLHRFSPAFVLQEKLDEPRLPLGVGANRRVGFELRVQLERGVNSPAGHALLQHGPPVRRIRSAKKLRPAAPEGQSQLHGLLAVLRKAPQDEVEGVRKPRVVSAVRGKQELMPPPWRRRGDIFLKELAQRIDPLRRTGLALETGQGEPPSEQERVAPDGLPVGVRCPGRVHVPEAGSVGANDPGLRPGVHPGAFQDERFVVGREP